MPKTNDKTLNITLDTQIYSKEAIYGAAYVFIDRMYIYLDMKGKDKIEVVFKPKEGSDKKKLEALKGEFQNELLHYVHRINLAKNNKKIRELIIERALYSSIEGDNLESDEFDDPLGIAVPWEEKYGDEKSKKKT